MKTRGLFETVYPVPRNVEWRESASMTPQYTVNFSACTATEASLAIRECNLQNARWEGFKAAIQVLGVLKGELLDKPEEEPVLCEDGKVKEFVIPQQGKGYFRCSCGCNVFHKPDKTKPLMFQCNACPARYQGE